MAKLGLFASLVAIVAVLGIATTSSPAESADACVHKDLKTDFVKNACAKGGQPEAKDQMKAFMKEHKIKSCNQCHSKLAPSYDLKPDGLKQFNDLLAKDAPAAK